ncbi:hypothetical protein N5E99_07300 [Pseudomonas chengduensis]|jgi:hypothetical protein|uniref:Uncharacterized protein n=2 Tax=Pseudomonadaceae TaxID=135621 RepID=A0A1G6MU17_9GAMM|nr:MULTISPECIES: hypothetical protein [Pseudomonas]KQO43781.1 hypothetical protein ASF15_00580 [Pseudomonas sp. Leaf83]MBP3061482.1 hypothetical protein [Pseudomonas chengduensis]MDH0958378.1 hypothetical protein [Pseudomonas chengduensis]MDH1535559.1 hypothetical protein [Pseudomonas chengduensis]MDH1623411.1 hypothetical protein [Pseudomonas chengduensis]
MLQPMQSQRLDELRTRLEEAGCVFDFVVSTLDPTATPGEAEHRQVLQILFELIEELARLGRLELIAQDSRFAKQRWPDLTPDFAQARPTAFNLIELHELASEDGLLCRNFRDPPYGTPLHVADFREWLQMLRLYPEEGMQVLDWVGNADTEPQRSTWRSYFDDGKELWGIWCLTLYNPRRRTLSALAASATD